ncbi:hypothetical protein NA57DRAFT_79762 [Rhizodiscina lignyota]|uniref:Transcription factor domain-containing protein n=1 Tax=Rhizodiscina lignyota TaxID=1504668 RepID=A0A9P4I9C1_9PEZI|nr:hypothetical protein NA57DRAFT_79762 [Rhizodiscina lignyota]
MGTIAGLEELVVLFGPDRAIECHYPANTPKPTELPVEHNDESPTKRRKLATSLVADSLSFEIRQEASRHDDIVLDSPLATSDPELADLLNWDNLDIEFPDFLNPQTNDDTVQDHSLKPPLIRHSTTWTDKIFQGHQTISSPNISIPKQPTSAVRSLIQRPKMKTGTQRTANLMLHTLKSYPLMMLRDNTLPPFIHPSWISSDVENQDMEPLNNCISLMHMIRSGVQGSRKLFWKNVRLECERWCEEHLKLNKWELLAALQALSIYILIRLDEGETDYNNSDFLLLTAVTVISKQLSRMDIAQSPNNRLNMNWKDWIFEDSSRRICVIYQVLNMLVYFEPAALCDLHSTGLILAPLPAKKQLWEACDEFVWKVESERESGLQTAFGLATNGELVKLEEGQNHQLYCSDVMLLSLDPMTPLRRSTANWEDWCSGMDALGGLVMLAASLIV